MIFLKSFDRFIYPGSPFLPEIKLLSVLEIANSVNETGLHPTTAIAHEVRYLGKDNFLDIYESLDWILEKFPIDDLGFKHFTYGFMLPVSLIIALDMIQDYSHWEIFNFLFNEDSEGFDDLTSFTADQMKRTAKLVNWEDPHPETSSRPIFDHCSLEVFTLDPWYLLGISSSRITYESFVDLFAVEVMEIENG